MGRAGDAVEDAETGIDGGATGFKWGADWIRFRFLSSVIRLVKDIAFFGNCRSVAPSATHVPKTSDTASGIADLMSGTRLPRNSRSFSASLLINWGQPPTPSR